MIPINQSDIREGFGNCMQAALASLFELSLAETINVMDYPENDWQDQYYGWLQSIGYRFVGQVIPNSSKRVTYRNLQTMTAINNCFFAAVSNGDINGGTHAVVTDKSGIVIHDPHPEKYYCGKDVVKSGDVIYWHHYKKVEV